MELKKTQFDEQPQTLVFEGSVIRINFCVEGVDIAVGNTASEEGESESKETRRVYEGYSVRIPQPMDRDKLIDAIVSAAYPSDKMQAIINNHALDEKDDEGYEEHLAEWKEMQKWRKTAKDVALEAMSVYLSAISNNQ